MNHFQRLADERTTLIDGMKSIVSNAQTTSRDLTTAEESDLKAANERVKGIDAEVAKIKSSMDLVARIGAIRPDSLDPIHGGQLFSESDAEGFVNAAKSKGNFGTTVRYKAALSLGGILPAIGSAVVVNPDARTTYALRDLFAPADAQGPTVRYYTLGEAAAVSPATEAVSIVAEGGLKPESDVDYAPVDKELVKLATRFTLTDELGEDAPFLVQEIQQSVLRAVLVRENKLVIDTINATSGVLTGTSTAATLIDLLATEIGASEAINGVTPTAMLVNPADLAAVRVAKASTGGGYFIDPLSNGPTSIHGVPLISTAATAAGTAYMLTSGFGTFYSRGALRVEAGFTGDDWIYNRMTVLAEERVLPVVNRPNLVTKLTLT